MDTSLTSRLLLDGAIAIKHLFSFLFNYLDHQQQTFFKRCVTVGLLTLFMLMWFVLPRSAFLQNPLHRQS